MPVKIGTAYCQSKFLLTVGLYKCICQFSRRMVVSKGRDVDYIGRPNILMRKKVTLFKAFGPFREKKLYNDAKDSVWKERGRRQGIPLENQTDELGGQRT